MFFKIVIPMCLTQSKTPISNRICKVRANYKINPETLQVNRTKNNSQIMKILF
jgi:hypothetical protein